MLTSQQPTPPEGDWAATKVVERHEDGSLLLAPEAVDEVIAETSERPLDGDEFLDALERLDVAASQQSSR